MAVVRSTTVLLVVLFHATVFAAQYRGLSAPAGVVQVNTA